MSETAAPNAAAAQTPPLTINVQYIKDLSFEVPGAPMIYTTLKTAPRVEINLDVQARRLAEGGNAYEVVLEIRAEANEAGSESPARVFLVELSYGGVFTLNGVPEQATEPVLLVECPRLLFPFARNILADITREGGFPPVLLQPIDFLALWQSRRAQKAANGAATDTPSLPN